eukprot:1161940-Pelagomonas_calceolata.AAC.1
MEHNHNDLCPDRACEVRWPSSGRQAAFFRSPDDLFQVPSSGRQATFFRSSGRPSLGRQVGLLQVVRSAFCRSSSGLLQVVRRPSSGRQAFFRSSGRQAVVKQNT